MPEPTQSTSVSTGQEPQNIPVNKLPPRGERRVKLVLKDGTEIACMINPTLMWIKRKFKETLRRQQINNSKLVGFEERRTALHEELRKRSAENDPAVAEAESNLTTLYNDVAKIEDANRSMNFELAALSVHFPVVKDKQISKDDIDWESCDEHEIEEAQRFFLLP
jgi:hypothetical protein